MERLTEHHVSGNGAYMKCSRFCTTAPDGTLASCDECEKLDGLVDRLAAYEDTGLEPEEIEGLLERGTPLEGGTAELMKKYLSIGSVDHLMELAQAEKDGRLVVLPLEAKDGDPIPQCFYGDDELCPGLSAQNDSEPIEQCKRCWYCSCGYRQEAEEALEREKGEN